MKQLLLIFGLSFALVSSATLFAQDDDVDKNSDSPSITVSISSDDHDDSESADPEELKRKLNEVIDAVANKVKHKIDKEIEIDMHDVSVKDLEDLEELKKEINESDWSDVGPAIGEAIAAVFFIVFIMGMPIIILLIVLIFGRNKRKQKMELINNFIARDQPVPPELIREFDTGEGDQLRSGLKWTLVGFAISVAFIVGNDGDGAAIGLIPMGLGLAKLIHWKMTEGKTE